MRTFLSSCFILCLVLFFSSCGLGEEKDKFSLAEIASEFNENCPRMVDQETRIDGIEILQPNTIVYKYTLINLPIANVDTTVFRNAMRPGLISMIKLSPEMKELRDAGIVFHYLYNDKGNHHIYTFKIGPDDYKP